MTAYHAEKVKFQVIPEDPIQVQMITLANGLKLYLSVNKDEPRIYTEIAVRAGSKHDPAETTGLAHYFEHMMFKGTDRLGSLDWESEKKLLDRIEILFEEHRLEVDPDKKKALYAEIDRLSFEAAKFVAANEYDKLVSAIGAKHTNAYTWVEQTVYVNDIPSNELERWFALESERFRRPILRLFHTELETVFEEYNISQDKDFRKVSRALQEILTPTHPYGTQTTLGRGEDLKNPSQTNIYRFFEKYYVPNNMAVVLCGDFDPEAAVVLAERYFGGFTARELPPFVFDPQPEPAGRIQRDVYGAEAAYVELAWRFPGAQSHEALLLPLIAGILHNYQAGLFDINLIQGQQLLDAYSYPRIHEDYCSLHLHGKPREGQSLQDVEAMLMAEIEKLRNGEFEDWLPGAVVNDLKLSEIKEFEKNQGRAGVITNAYILGLDWSEMVGRWPILEKVTKADVVEFAKKYLKTDNYAVVFKHTGEDKTVMKVEKPTITPVEVNRIDISMFAQEFLNQDTPEIQPQFLDFKALIKHARLGPKQKLHAVHDPQSQLFRLHYIFDMGRTADRRLPILANYIQFLGTKRYTPTQIQQAFYRLGVNFSAVCQDETFFITLTGLASSFEAGVELMEHLLQEAQPEPIALKNLVADILKRRENEKQDKRVILSKAMFSFAKYGSHSPFTDKMSQTELAALEPEELIGLLTGLNTYKHDVFYNGRLTASQAAAIMKKYRLMPETYKSPLPAKKFRERGVKQPRVYVVNFPTVQVELLLVAKGTPRFSLHEYIFSDWYNQYFGYGLSSIVFQEIRESKALAYSTYVSAMNPVRKNRAHFLQAYVGTQPDKLYEATEAFQRILENMPVSPVQIENARQSVLKQIAAGRITKSDIYWTWRSNRDRGFTNRDLRMDIYNTLETSGLEDLLQYQHDFIRQKQFTWMILGDKSRLDFNFLKQIGPVKELTLEEIFGY